MGADRAAFRLSAKAGTYGEDAASETQYSRTSPLPLSDTAFLQVDLCITMSAERGHDQCRGGLVYNDERRAWA